MKKMNFTLNNSSIEMLKNISIDQKLTMSDIIRRAIEHYYFMIKSRNQ